MQTPGCHGSCNPDPQLLVVNKEFNLKIGPVPKAYLDDFNGRTPVCGKVNNISKIACSPDGSLFCVRNGDLYTGPLTSNKDTDWFCAARRVGKCGWDEFKIIFFHPDGTFYGATCNGDLYKGPKPNNENVCWRDCVATRIGCGNWNQYEALFFHPNGTLYAVCKDDTFVKGNPPTSPGNWLATTTKVGRGGWLRLTHFMAFSPDGNLWSVDKNDGKIYKKSPPVHENDNYVGFAENLGHSYNIYKFLCFR
ncbi:uncharacterized protein [Phyllobates terribilis]|uniref:uncharacterized protein n=1 Tax=Phyllobates terribilis TaxID=111132 RepID=UPI003CCB4466